MQKIMHKFSNDSSAIKSAMWLRHATTASFVFFFAKGLLWIAAAAWIAL